MSQTITIDPVTRLEGHGKITIQLNGQGEVEDAHFHVTQVRGFERFSEGRPFYEMPSLMARICGICPVSHLVASAKACEAIMSVRIPHTAAQLRRMLNLAQMVQSHALSFFYLSSPDLLLGMESDPATRHIFGVVGAKPELGRAGIALRRFGQHIIELLGNKRIHPGWVVPGGVTEPLASAKRDEILGMLPEAYASIKLALAWYKQIADTFRPEIEVFANFPSLYMGLINEDESVEFTDGALRLIDAKGAIVADGITANQFTEVIGEAVEPYSFTKFAYYKPLGYPAGSYRVGPLARLNIAKSMGTPLADKELVEFKQLAAGPVQSSFYYHHGCPGGVDAPLTLDIILCILEQFRGQFRVPTRKHGLWIGGPGLPGFPLAAPAAYPDPRQNSGSSSQLRKRFPLRSEPHSSAALGLCHVDRECGLCV